MTFPTLPFTFTETGWDFTPDFSEENFSTPILGGNDSARKSMTSGPCLNKFPQQPKKTTPVFFWFPATLRRKNSPTALKAREEPMPLLPTPLASPGLATPNTVSRRSRKNAESFVVGAQKKRWKMEIAEGWHFFSHLYRAIFLRTLV